MRSIASDISRSGYFLRRRDLLALGHSDRRIRSALEQHLIFRVRHGWYSVPRAPEAAVRAVRVGGRLTSLSALESYGLPVPRSPLLHVAVRPSACRLRSPADRRVRLTRFANVVVHWTAVGARSPWRVTPSEALLAVLCTETRDIALACFGAALHKRLITPAALGPIFAQAPARVQAWRLLVSSKDESHGESFFRLWAADAGVACEQQVEIAGVGRFDFRLGPHTYVEIDGAQHDPTWTGETASSWENDLERAARMQIRGDTVLHFGYRLLYSDWPTVLAAIERALADDAALTARRRRHPYRPPPPSSRRKRRRYAPKRPPP